MLLLLLSALLTVTAVEEETHVLLKDEAICHVEPNEVDFCAQNSKICQYESPSWLFTYLLLIIHESLNYHSTNPLRDDENEYIPAQCLPLLLLLWRGGGAQGWDRLQHPLLRVGRYDGPFLKPFKKGHFLQSGKGVKLNWHIILIYLYLNRSLSVILCI